MFVVWRDILCSLGRQKSKLIKQKRALFLMFIVAVTACPTGIAHTYIAADKLKKAAKKLGVEIKVETQGTIGISNELGHDDMARADVVMLASDVAIAKMDRFEGKRILQVPLSDAVKDPEGLIRRAMEC